MKREENPNAEGVESAVKKLVSETLDKIIDGEAIGDASDLIGNVAVGGNNAAGAGAKGDGVESLVKGFKSIVDIVLMQRRQQQMQLKQLEQ